jgi:hypothetical protein
MNIDQRYVARLLAATGDDAAEALAQLSRFWSGRAKLSETGDLTGLSPAETAAHLALWYFGEVGNGGHTQYFMNPTGSLAHETVAALEMLGLEQAAKTLRDACQMFPGRQVPKEQTARFAAIEALDREHYDLLYRSDLAIWAITGQIDIDILRYLQQHKDEVLTPEPS